MLGSPRRPPRRSRVFLAPLIVLTVLLLGLDLLASPDGTDRVRGVASAVLGPAVKLTSGAGRAVSDAGASLSPLPQALSIAAATIRVNCFIGLLPKTPTRQANGSILAKFRRITIDRSEIPGHPNIG